MRTGLVERIQRETEKQIHSRARCFEKEKIKLRSELFQTLFDPTHLKGNSSIHGEQEQESLCEPQDVVIPCSEVETNNDSDCLPPDDFYDDSYMIKPKHKNNIYFVHEMKHDPPIILNYMENEKFKSIHKYSASSKFTCCNSDHHGGHTIDGGHCSDCAKDLFTYVTIGSPYELENEIDKSLRYYSPLLHSINTNDPTLMKRTLELVTKSHNESQKILECISVEDYSETNNHELNTVSSSKLINYQDKNGNNAGHLAFLKNSCCKQTQTKVVSILLRFGLNPEITNSVGLRPLDLGCISGNASAVQALLDHGAKKTLHESIKVGDLNPDLQEIFKEQRESQSPRKNNSVPKTKSKSETESFDNSKKSIDPISPEEQEMLLKNQKEIETNQNEKEKRKIEQKQKKIQMINKMMSDLVEFIYKAKEIEKEQRLYEQEQDEEKENERRKKEEKIMKEKEKNMLSKNKDVLTETKYTTNENNNGKNELKNSNENMQKKKKQKNGVLLFNIDNTHDMEFASIAFKAYIKNKIMKPFQRRRLRKKSYLKLNASNFENSKVFETFRIITNLCTSCEWEMPFINFDLNTSSLDYDNESISASEPTPISDAREFAISCYRRTKITNVLEIPFMKSLLDIFRSIDTTGRGHINAMQIAVYERLLVLKTSFQALNDVRCVHKVLQLDLQAEVTLNLWLNFWNIISINFGPEILLKFLRRHEENCKILFMPHEDHDVQIRFTI